MIIFNERDYAERIIDSGWYHTLQYQGQERRALAKYLKYKRGYDDQQIKDFVGRIKSKRKEIYDDDVYESIMDKLVEKYDKTEYVYDLKVGVSQDELNIILLQPTIELRNLLFVLLVYYKWALQTQDRLCVRNNTIWVKEADLDCCKIARLGNLRKDERIKLFSDLYSSGLYDSDYIRRYHNIFTLNFVDDKEPVIVIDDFHDILAHLEYYLDPNSCIHCSYCNSLIHKTGHNHKMCKECRKHRKHQKTATSK